MPSENCRRTSAINRQIADLWFTLIYMMDEFDARSLAHELGSYSEFCEEITKNLARFGSDPEWQLWREDMQELKELMESQLPITPEQKADPTHLGFWPTPFKMLRQPTASLPFIKFLHDLLYLKMSSEAHLKPAGLMVGAGILLSDVAPESVRKAMEGRTVHQDKYTHVFHTVVAVLGVISEIEMHCKLGNTDQIVRVWKVIADNNPDAKDVYAA